MEITKVQNGKIIKETTNMTLRELISYLDNQNLQEGIKVRNINGMFVVGWK